MQLQLRLNPDNQLVTRKDIIVTRDRLEQAPIISSISSVDYSFDADQISIERMQYTYDYWLSLNELESSEVRWTLSDNTEILIGMTDFDAVLMDVKQKKGVRMNELHKTAKDFIALLPDVTVLDIDDANW